MNIQQMMKQAQNMQRKMQENQEKLSKMEFEGKAGNGIVSITLMGTGSVKSVKLNKSIVDPDDIEMLEDLIVVAFNDAKSQLDSASEESMNDATGGINLKNFKLPF